MVAPNIQQAAEKRMAQENKIKGLFSATITMIVAA